jgi:hypothetical protein
MMRSDNAVFVRSTLRLILSLGHVPARSFAWNASATIFSCLLKCFIWLLLGLDVVLSRANDFALGVHDVANSAGVVPRVMRPTFVRRFSISGSLSRPSD